MVHDGPGDSLPRYSGIQIPKVKVCTPISAYWEITANIGEIGRNPYCLNQ